jgi:hypothetical protein
MDLNDYEKLKLMNFFPPVNNNIKNPYEEAEYSYNSYNASSPLKKPDKNKIYSIQIINDLRMLRILLHSNLTHERFLYEINKMYEAWGPSSRNILNSQFINIFTKIILKEQKLQKRMKEGGSIATDYELGQLEKQLGDFSFKHKYKPLKDLDFSKLNINSIQ